MEPQERHVRVRLGVDERPFGGVSHEVRLLVYALQREGVSFDLQDDRVVVRPVDRQRRRALAVLGHEIRDLLRQERERPA